MILLERVLFDFCFVLGFCFMGKLITPLTLISRFPIPVNLTRPDLKKELDRGRRTVVLPLSHRGTQTAQRDTTLGFPGSNMDNMVLALVAVSTVFFFFVILQ